MKAFKLNHEDSHSGVKSTAHRLKISTWWPNMDKDIEDMVGKCQICRRVRFRGDRAVHKWPEAAPFERMHMDWADVPGAGLVLVMVDAGSGWIEAFPTRDRSSKTVIKCLRTIFTRFGVPELMVSDNGKEFVSRELNLWLERQGVKKMESPPYFPRANGLAERAVRTLKSALVTWKESVYHSDFNTFLQRVLFHHRISAFSRGKSPAEIIFGRQLRVPVVSRFQQGEPVWYKPAEKLAPRSSVYLMTKGQNTSWLLDHGELRLVSNNQITRAAEEGNGDSDGPEATRDDSSGEQAEHTTLDVPSRTEPGDGSNLEEGDSLREPRRSGRSRSAPNRWGYGVDFKPMDS